MAQRPPLDVAFGGTDELRTERLLLRAALGRDDAALEAWRAWRVRAKPIDDMPNEQHRLLPLLHANLTRHGVNDPDMARYAAVRRFYWVRQQSMLRSVQPVLEALSSAGVRMMLLKGLPLQQVYARAALRPTSDLDLWVPRSDLPAAFRSLTELGFLPVNRRLQRDGAGADAYAVQHAVTLRRDADGLEVDLHARLHKSIPSISLADMLFRRATPLTVAATSVVRLSLEGSILHAAAHGLGSETGSAVRGIADVATLLEDGRDVIDWEELKRLAREAEALTAVATMVTEAYEAMGIPVPQEAAAALDVREASRADRWGWKLVRPGQPRQVFRSVLLSYLRARSAAKKDAAPPMTLVRFAQGFAHARTAAEGVGIAARFPVKRLAAGLRR